MGTVNYVIDMHDARKRERTFHTNMLKKWNSPSQDCYSVMVDTDGLWEEEGDGDIPVWNDKESGEPIVSEQLSEAQKNELLKLLQEFSDVLSSHPGRTKMAEHKVMTTSNSSVRLPPYRLPYAYRDVVQKEIHEMLEAGIIEPSDSEWAFPVVLARKKDGALRLCIDYRWLNAVSQADSYPMPRVDELIDRLGKAKYITTLDLTRGYWQVPMAETSRHLTAFTTPFGLFQVRVMPFGLQGTPATFQRLMHGVLRGVRDYAAAYIDDVVIHGFTWEEHLSQIEAVLGCLRKADLTAKPQKCQFGMAKCVYLGHRVGGGTVEPDPCKVEAVREFLVPKTIKDVRQFLGLTGYYRKFIPLPTPSLKQLGNRHQMWLSGLNSVKKRFYACRTYFATFQFLGAPILRRSLYSRQMLLT